MNPETKIGLHCEPSDFMVITPTSSFQANGEISFINFNSLSNLSEASTDLSLSEIHCKFKELLKENMNLKETIQQNSNLMRDQYSELVKWRDQIKNAEEQHIAKYEETKKVVLQLKVDKKNLEEKVQHLEDQLQENELQATANNNLKQQLFEKGQEIEALEKHIAHKESETEVLVDVISNEVYQQQLLSLEAKHKANCEENEGNKLKIKRLIEEREELHKIMMEMDMLLKSVHTSNERLEIENGVLIKTKNEMKNELELLSKEYQKLVALHQRLQIEKQDMMALNNDLTTQLENEKKQSIENSFLFLESNTENSSPVAAVMKTSAITALQNRHGVSDLLIQLQEEREKIAYLTSQITEQQAMIEKLQKEVCRRDESLQVSAATDVQRSLEHEAKVEELFSHLSSLNSDIQHEEASAIENKVAEDMQCLRQQVLSLVNELSESENKFKAVDASLIKYRNRCCDLEHRLTLTQEEMETLQTKDDALIDQLRVEICSMERQLGLSKEQCNSLKRSIEETRQKYENLSKDYSEMHAALTQMQKKSWENESAFSIEWIQERKRLLEKADNLMAQLMAAKESLTNKNEELQTLKTENAAIKKQIEILPLLQAQVEVYRDDFQAERSAREQQHCEMGKLKDENQQLQLRNQQLQDELNQMNQNKLQLMQRRHGNYAKYSRREESSSRPRDAQAHLGTASSQASPQKYMCPKCQKCYTNISILEKHVEECLNDENFFMM